MLEDLRLFLRFSEWSKLLFDVAPIERFIVETFQFNGRLPAAGDRLTKPLGLTSSRWQVAGVIEVQSLYVAQIARNMGLVRQNVQRLADALEKAGQACVFNRARTQHHEETGPASRTVGQRDGAGCCGEIAVEA